MFRFTTAIERGHVEIDLSISYFVDLETDGSLTQIDHIRWDGMDFKTTPQEKQYILDLIAERWSDDLHNLMRKSYVC